MSIFVRARFEVQPQKESAFGRIAVDLRNLAKQEPGVLSYEWYSATDPGVYFALEQFANSQAMMTHAGIAEDLLSQLAQNSQMVSMELYGEIDARLRAVVGGMPQSLTIFNPIL